MVYYIIIIINYIIVLHTLDELVFHFWSTQLVQGTINNFLSRGIFLY